MSTTFPLHAGAHVTEPERKHRGNCPFWATSSVKCSICNGGLFIPLEDHREAFCKTPHFSSCNQFLFYTENQIYLREMVRNSGENRRKYLRIETSHTITLLKIINAGQLVSSSTSGSKAIDLSKGGMRLVTEKPLTHDSTVQLSFDDSFPQDLREVTGLVAWCNKQVDEPGYQAGVSFQGEHITKAMARYLGQFSQHM